MDNQDFRSALEVKLKTFDRKGAEEVCEKLIAEIYRSPVPFSDEVGGKIMQDLRSKRMFDLMQHVGDALILAGSENFKIRKLYSQALIDQNYLVAARSVIYKLIADTETLQESDHEAAKEAKEARGLLGRIYKQLYINTSVAEESKVESFLRQSVGAYYSVFQADKKFTWHGINAVALMFRARNDGIEVSDYPSPDILSREILSTIEKRYKDDEADAWDFATAAEACVALGDTKNALEWLSGYARMPYADAFELASTLRQLEEVWQLDASSEAGQLLLPILKAELLARQGGTVVVDGTEIGQRTSIEDNYRKLVTERDLPESTLEKAFSNDSLKTYEWYKTGADRCLAVAHIAKPMSTGIGTGFLLKGEALHEKLTGEMVLLTNAHVVSEDPAEKKALSPSQATITFEILNSQEKFKASEIVWSSPRRELDATLLRFDAENLARLKELTKAVALYPVATDELPPVIEDEQPERIFIIGHPNGGKLQLSLYDNFLLDHEEPRIHYRTPTEVGNSGSPVFNQQWELIGLHHAGSTSMPKLNGKQGTYEANEGIWIHAIKKALNIFFAQS